MTSQVNGLDQGVRNAQDGINLVQTADGALGESSAILQRLRQLAVAAANTGAVDEKGRADMQAEAEQLMDELDRIVSGTDFNGTKLLDSTFVDKQFQVGSDSGDSIPVDIRGPFIYAGDPGSPEQDYGHSSISMSSPAMNNWTGLGQMTFSVAATPPVSETVDLSGATDLDTAYAALSSAFGSDSRFTVSKNDTLGTLSVSDRTKDGLPIDVSDTALGDVDAIGGDGTGHPAYPATDPSISFTVGLESEEPIDQGGGGHDGDLGDLRTLTSIDLDLDGSTVTVPIDPSKFTSSDDVDELISQINTALTANGLSADFRAELGDWYEYDTPHTGDVIHHDGHYEEPQRKYWDANGQLTSTPGGYSAGDFPGQRAQIRITSLSASDADHAVGISVAAKSGGTTVLSRSETGQAPIPEALPSGVSRSYAHGTIPEVPAEPDVYAGLDSVGLLVRGYYYLDEPDDGVSRGPQVALQQIDFALSVVARTRATLGATQNRFTHAITIAQTSSLNLNAARSQIRDTDMADAVSRLTTGQILASAGQSMLSQAMKAPQVVLSLLQQ